MKLELSAEEHDLLAELLDEDFRDLKAEIGDTDSSEYKQRLRERERVLAGLLHKVQQSATV